MPQDGINAKGLARTAREREGVQERRHAVGGHDLGDRPPVDLRLREPERVAPGLIGVVQPVLAVEREHDLRGPVQQVAVTLLAGQHRSLERFARGDLAHVGIRLRRGARDVVDDFDILVAPQPRHALRDRHAPVDTGADDERRREPPAQRLAGEGGQRDRGRMRVGVRGREHSAGRDGGAHHGGESRMRLRDVGRDGDTDGLEHGAPVTVDHAKRGDRRPGGARRDARCAAEARLAHGVHERTPRDLGRRGARDAWRGRRRVGGRDGRLPEGSRPTVGRRGKLARWARGGDARPVRGRCAAGARPVRGRCAAGVRGRR